MCFTWETRKFFEVFNVLIQLNFFNIYWLAKFNLHAVE